MNTSISELYAVINGKPVCLVSEEDFVRVTSSKISALIKPIPDRYWDTIGIGNVAYSLQDVPNPALHSVISASIERLLRLFVLTEDSVPDVAPNPLDVHLALIDEDIKLIKERLNECLSQQRRQTFKASGLEDNHIHYAEYADTEVFL